jgi:hypothetical protein
MDMLEQALKTALRKQPVIESVEGSEYVIGLLALILPVVGVATRLTGVS